MGQNRIIAGIAGVVIFLSIVLTFVWFLSPANSDQPKKLDFDEILRRIDSKQIKEAAFKANSVELTDNDGKKFIAGLSSAQTREALISKIDQYNQINTSKPINFSLEPASSGWGGIVLINTLPFFIMWAVTLAVIVYAVRTLSRNKG